jgi:hypothetical protein
LQAAFGGAATVGGRRVTTEADVQIVRMALSGSANKRLVSALVDSGIDAVGLSGEDAGLIAAAPVDVETMGYVGRPCRINVAFLEHLLSGGTCQWSRRSAATRPTRSAPRSTSTATTRRRRSPSPCMRTNCSSSPMSPASCATDE